MDPNNPNSYHACLVAGGYSFDESYVAKSWPAGIYNQTDVMCPCIEKSLICMSKYTHVRSARRASKIKRSG